MKYRRESRVFHRVLVNFLSLGLLSVGVELDHYLALGAVGILISTHWWLTNANMQDDLAIALWASPDVVSFRYWLGEQY